MKLLTVYILKCRDNSYYTGVTNNLDRRLIEHQTGENIDAYTYNKRPVELVYHDDFFASEAIDFERQIKGWRRAKKEALIKGEWGKLPELSKSYSDKNKK